MRLAEFVTALKNTGRSSDGRPEVKSDKAAEYLRKVRESAGRNEAEQNNAPQSAETRRKSIADRANKEIIRRGNIPAKNAVFERCLTEAANWAGERPVKWLVITGPVGSGKSTLAKAVAETVSEEQGMYSYSAMRATTANWEKPDELMKRSGSAVLVIDDLGCEQTDIRLFGNNVSPMAEILMERYDRILPTIITTNLPPSKIEEVYGDRIADRFREMATVILMDGESFRKPIKNQQTKQ